jgi:hypothetical protein
MSRDFLAPIRRWNVPFVPLKCSSVASVAAKTGTIISYAMDAVSPIKNGGCSNLMERLNSPLVYSRCLLPGDRFDTRLVSAIRSNSTVFAFVIGLWTILLH